MVWTVTPETEEHPLQITEVETAIFQFETGPMAQYWECRKKKLKYFVRT